MLCKVYILNDKFNYGMVCRINIVVTIYDPLAS